MPRRFPRPYMKGAALYGICIRYFNGFPTMRTTRCPGRFLRSLTLPCRSIWRKNRSSSSVAYNTRSLNWSRNDGGGNEWQRKFGRQLSKRKPASLRPKRRSEFDPLAFSARALLRCSAGERSALGHRPFAHLVPLNRAPARSVPRAHRNPGQISVGDRFHIEFLGRGRHPRQCLRDRHGRLGVALLGLVKPNGIDPRGHVIAQVWGLESALGQRGDDFLDLRVDLQQTSRVALSLAQARVQRALAEPIDLFQERAIRAAREPGCFLIHDAQGNKFGRLELRRKLRLLGAAAALRQTAGHAHDLEAPVAQVVRLLGVERENSIGQRLVRGNQDRDLLEPEHLPRGQAMTAIGCP